MGLKLVNLDASTRRYMLRELLEDARQGSLVLSPRLNDYGRKNWPDVLREAIQHHDEMWLAKEIRERNFLVAQERAFLSWRNEFIMRRVPSTAPFTLAEAEFNRYYIRGICLRALSEGLPEVEVYRAKKVEDPRTSSQAQIGTRVSAAQLLEDLRRSTRVLKIPGGPNSGVSVRLPEEAAA